MGNRAVIQFTDTQIGIYLHWNGGRNSVEAFLQVAKDLAVRTTDPSYRLSRLCQIIGNTLGGTVSLGIDLVENLDTDNWDNGTYVVDPEFNIVDRLHLCNPEQESVSDGIEEFEWVLDANRAHFDIPEALASRLATRDSCDEQPEVDDCKCKGSCSCTPEMYDGVPADTHST